jgi:hypothetical protein
MLLKVNGLVVCLWVLLEMGEDYGVIGFFGETGGFHVV